MLLFGFSTLIQFQLEIPEFLPAQSNVVCEEVTDSNFDPNCQHADYDIFRSWCLGNRCDDHAVKGYVKEIAEDGTTSWRYRHGICLADWVGGLGSDGFCRLCGGAPRRGLRNHRVRSWHRR